MNHFDEEVVDSLVAHVNPNDFHLDALESVLDGMEEDTFTRFDHQFPSKNYVHECYQNDSLGFDLSWNLKVRLPYTFSAYTHSNNTTIHSLNFLFFNSLPTFDDLEDFEKPRVLAGGKRIIIGEFNMQYFQIGNFGSQLIYCGKNIED